MEEIRALGLYFFHSPFGASLWLVCVQQKMFAFTTLDEKRKEYKKSLY